MGLGHSSGGEQLELNESREICSVQTSTGESALPELNLELYKRMRKGQGQAGAEKLWRTPLIS